MAVTKAIHKTANYRAGSGDRRCKNCTMFRPPSACTAVQSPIRPEDVCDYFQRKRSSALAGLKAK